MKVLAAKVRSSYLYPVWITCCFVTKLVFPVSMGNYAKENRAMRGITVTCTAVTQSPLEKYCGIWKRLNYWGSCPGFLVYWGNYHCTAFLFWPLSSCIVGSFVSILYLTQRAGSAVPIHEDGMSFYAFEKRPLALQQSSTVLTQSSGV